VYYDEADNVWEVHATPDPDAIVVRRGTTAANARAADIGIVDLSQGSFAPFAATGANENGMALSPDGHWLAYVTDESGRREVVVQPFPGGGARTQVSSEGGSEPVWSTSGDRLFYRDPDLWMMAVDVSTTPSFRVTNQKRLFPSGMFTSGWTHRQYQVAGDGRFLMLAQPGVGGSSEGDLILVENWFTEVRERIGG